MSGIVMVMWSAAMTAQDADVQGVPTRPAEAVPWLVVFVC